MARNGTNGRKSGWLDTLEKVGNKLPDPSTLFVIGALVVMVLSHFAVAGGWTAQPMLPQAVTRPVLDADGLPVLDAQGQPINEPVLDARGRVQLELVAEGDAIEPKSLLTSAQ
jgi:hypothetical protein